MMTMMFYVNNSFKSSNNNNHNIDSSSISNNIKSKSSNNSDSCRSKLTTNSSCNSCCIDKNVVNNKNNKITLMQQQQHKNLNVERTENVVNINDKIYSNNTNNLQQNYNNVKLENDVERNSYYCSSNSSSYTTTSLATTTNRGNSSNTIQATIKSSSLKQRQRQRRCFNDDNIENNKNNNNSDISSNSNSSRSSSLSNSDYYTSCSFYNSNFCCTATSLKTTATTTTAALSTAASSSITLSSSSPPPPASSSSPSSPSSLTTTTTARKCKNYSLKQISNITSNSSSISRQQRSQHQHHHQKNPLRCSSSRSRSTVSAGNIIFNVHNIISLFGLQLCCLLLLRLTHLATGLAVGVDSTNANLTDLGSPAHSERIKLTYRPARNNPLDLYVLMDLTWTMRDDRDTLVKLGSELATTLNNLTSNYRLGFGSFADKPEMPMIMPHLKSNPCATEGKICEPTYGYRHHLSLTEDETLFVRSVNGSKVTGNLDNLEGGFDALMQVLVCPKEIGWKEEARKVVIMVTDGFMHFAGDGLLAGIVKRNDKQCHLSPEGEYLGSLEYDYPSLEEIYRELVKRKISVIFAVTEQVVTTYREISNLMKEITNVEILSADSSNILELIKKSYESFIKRTQFTDNSPEFIKIEYETDCGGQFPSLRKRNYCNNVELGKTVDFYINITLTDFPDNGVYTHKIRVEESALNEYMDIEVDIQKPCPCGEEPQPDDEDGRIQCSDNGYLQCGMCHCDVGWTGTFCNCPTETTNATTKEAIENLCRQPLAFGETIELGAVCSNRGECDCGTCFCFPGFNGKFCECPECDIDCDPERADCICGECVCKYGWSGNRCNCKESTDGCIGPTGEICSGRGYCECGECLCDEPYMGKFCEIGSETENKLCAFYEPCVTCLIEEKTETGKCERTSDLCSSAEQNERFTTAFVTEEIDVDIRCLARVENKFGIKCDHYFTYQTMGQSENYLIIQLNSCEPVNYMAVIGFVSLATFILGLLIIMVIWACVRAKDAREYARFEKDLSKGYLMESPIYRDPIGRYIVPKEVNRKQSNPFL